MSASNNQRSRILRGMHCSSHTCAAQTHCGHVSACVRACVHPAERLTSSGGENDFFCMANHESWVMREGIFLHIENAPGISPQVLTRANLHNFTATFNNFSFLRTDACEALRSSL